MLQNENFHTTCAITHTNLIVGRTKKQEHQQTTEILVFSREKIEKDPVVLTSFHDMTEVHLYSQDNTLVVLERRAVENMITSIITIDNFKISLYNSSTLGLLDKCSPITLQKSLVQNM